jgi:hypothetical protein
MTNNDKAGQSAVAEVFEAVNNRKGPVNEKGEFVEIPKPKKDDGVGGVRHD